MKKETILKTERLIIRPLCYGDLHSTYNYAGSPENARYMVFLPHESIEETRAFLKEAENQWRKEFPEFYEFAVMLNDVHIGAITIYADDYPEEVELGWILHREYWGHGYAKEAACAVKEFAINQLGVKRIIATCDSRNADSTQVMKGIGMKLESSDRIRYNKGATIPSKELLYSLSPPAT